MTEAKQGAAKGKGKEEAGGSRKNVRGEEGEEYAHSCVPLSVSLSVSPSPFVSLAGCVCLVMSLVF